VRLLCEVWDGSFIIKGHEPPPDDIPALTEFLSIPHSEGHSYI
jgi:hypothetical protein